MRGTGFAIHSYDAAMEPEDARLLVGARAGDVEAFAEFVRRYERRVRSVLFRLLDDARDVEEAAQDVFVQAWRHLDSFRGDAAVFTWLYRIAVNEALQRRRRRQLQTTELEERDAVVEDEPEVREAGTVLLAKLRELPEEYRAPVVLRDVEGLSNEEVAYILGISVAAVKSRVHRGRMQLRAAFQEGETGDVR
jgi:RNA polymerase sigma-70 factor (ECF subfamily)